MTTDRPKCCEEPKTSVPQKCPHLQPFKDNGGISAFQAIQQYLQTQRTSFMKLPRPKCQSCTNTSRLHACMQCVFFACKPNGHLLNHFKETNHFLGVDVTHHEVYCNQCGDYVYDSELDNIVSNESKKANDRVTMLLDPNRKAYHPWTASKDEMANIGKNSQPLKVSKNILGLRGLINLGNTCFMNCILQSFVHNPLMRNYFLSDRHNNKECRQKYRRDQPDSDGLKGDVCLGCEMDVLFEQIFSGAKTPYTPHHILHSIWKFANYFAGYEQQDAHEFLISSLNGLHTHLERTNLLRENSQNNKSNTYNNDSASEDGHSERCNCIVHTIFKGMMRSEVTCSSCGFTSATEDPFFDISLDIPKAPSSSSSSAPAPPVSETQPPSSTPPMSPPQQPPSPSSASPLTGNKRSADEMGDGLLSPVPTSSPVASFQSPPPVNSKLLGNTLAACLDRFTQPERLGSDEKFLCSRCHTRQESIKQLSMKSLPICFHLKRFEQLANSRHSNKIDTFIEFPSILDMSPYTSLNVKPPNIPNGNGNKGNKKHQKNDKSGDDTKAPDDLLTYQLFAVVNHQGRMDTGHYTCFVKHDDTWYKCDDATITVATLPNVLHSKGYLLFYMKHHLEYGTEALKKSKNNNNNRGSEDES